MPKPKRGVVTSASIATKRQMAIDPTDSVPPKQVASSRTATQQSRAPDKFTYTLKQHTAERRQDGWWVAKTPITFVGEKPGWAGPYPTIEDACLAIARLLAAELGNRHAVHIGDYKLTEGHPLYGFKPTTQLADKDPPTP